MNGPLVVVPNEYPYKVIFPCVVVDVFPFANSSIPFIPLGSENCHHAEPSPLSFKLLVILL